MICIERFLLLRRLPDAVLVDSTALTLEQVLDYMLSFIEEQADVL